MPEFARNPIKFITRLQQECGDVAAFSLMGKKSVLISNPEDIERVLLETGKRYSNGKQAASSALGPILGNGLVTSEGDFGNDSANLLHRLFTTSLSSNMPTKSSHIRRTWQRLGKAVLSGIFIRT